MKLYLNSNILKGTPEELVTYQELLKDRGLTKGESEKSLFSFGHMHESTEYEADVQEEEDSMHDEGAFYTVTEEAGDSPLTVGTILQHQYGNLFIDSIGQRCRISRPSFVERGSTHNFDDKIKQDRFELAKELGIKLTSTTDFAVETSNRKLKLKKDDGIFAEGELVKISRDDKDRLPLVQSVEDPYRKEDFVYISKIGVVEDTFKGFFGSLMLDKSSIGTTESSTESSTDEEQPPSTELKVGDRVKVLRSNFGAEGEATVTAVLGAGGVKIAGTSKSGKYLDDWSNNVANLEKIEEESPSIEQVVEDLLLYDYYEVVDPDCFASSVEKGTVFKVTGNNYTLLNREGNDRDYIDVVTSTGLTQTSPVRDSIIKPIIDNSFIAGRFKFAKEVGINLKVDTDFEEECKGHHFKVTKDEYLSNFTPTDILTVRRDDNTNAIAFQSFSGNVQYTLLAYTKEVARPSK